MVSKEIKQSVKEYRLLWHEAGVELSSPWHSSRVGGAASAVQPAATGGAVPKALQSAVPPLDSLEAVRGWLGDCSRCKLSSGRNRIVFGEGNPKAALMFVGEGPGADEDASGLPFVGRAGELLTKIIEAMGYDRSRDTYIANIVKCRPPENRSPAPDEAFECSPFLQAQIRIVQPRIVIALGASAATHLLGTDKKISSLRGRILPLKWDPSVSVMPTFHPAYLLRNPEAKKEVWEDMKKVLEFLGGASR